MLITDLLRKNAQNYPQEEALVALDSGSIRPFDDDAYAASRQSMTWKEFDEAANRVANYFHSIGIGEGKRIAIMLRNRIEWLPIYFGVLRSGAVAVPLNFRYAPPDIIRSVAFAEVDALIFSDYCLPNISASLKDISRVKVFLYLGPEDKCPDFALPFCRTVDLADSASPHEQLSSDEMAAIYFSSGTTGAPKAVVYTHGTLERAWELEHNNHKQVHDDVFLLVPPLYHVGGKLHWMGNLPVGAHCVMLLGFSVEAFFEVMRREHLTITFLLLPWVQDILAAIESGRIDLSLYDTSSWRMNHMGAQTIPPLVIRQMQKYFPDLEYEVSYGLTESGGPGCLNLTSDRMDKLGSVGQPSPGWEARVVDSNDNDVEVGRTGELILRGPGVMREYYKNPELTAKTLRGGWLHTGDVARKDADGFYYIVGRIKDIIIIGGENIYPVEIEDFLRRHSAVQDVAVFGVCDQRLGEQVAAQVELKPGMHATEQELLDFCAPLPRITRPKKIFIGAVPRNPTGKIDKKALRSMYSPHPFTENGKNNP